jgi:beta-glucuronidase
MAVLLTVSLPEAKASDAKGELSFARASVVAAEPGPLIMAGALPASTHVDRGNAPRYDLAGSWDFRFDDQDRGVREQWFQPVEALARSWEHVRVPGAWDMIDKAHFNHQSIAWYTRRFTPPALGAGVQLRFEGIFREARVWLNGHELGSYDLPYLPFAFDVDPVLHAGESNMLVVRIDNRITRQTLPADTLYWKGRHGWFPYGGIFRPVALEARGPRYVARAPITATADGNFQCKLEIEQGQGLRGSPGGEAWIERRGMRLAHWQLPPLPSDRQSLRLNAQLPDVEPWSPETPSAIYQLVVRLDNPEGPGPEAGYDFAFRTFAATGGRVLLNGKDRFLFGINRHEDHPTNGPVFDAAVMQGDLALIHTLGADFVRPGHYPNDVRSLAAYERAGVMAVEEVPVYQWDQFEMADTRLLDKAKRALEGMIVRDANRPGVVMWSLANEIHNFVPAARPFLAMMAKTAHTLDPTRPTFTAAIVLPPVSAYDTASGEADVIGVNPYFGWYYGLLTDAEPYIRALHERFPQRTMIISEYGADTLQGRHKDPALVGEEDSHNHSYSEEYQAFFHRHYLDLVERTPYLRGVMPWVLADFRYQWTPFTGKPHPIPLYNLKGLTSMDRVPKLAFSLVAERYRRWRQTGVQPAARAGISGGGTAR